MTLYGGIEAGGTKFVCGVGTGPDDLVRSAEIDSRQTPPVEVVAQCAAFFRDYVPSLAAFGIASFGPVNLVAGQITSTPKLAWRDFLLLHSVRTALDLPADLPIGFDTDVNGAALAEGRWGAAGGLDTFVYLTVGTGIGGGAVVNGAPLHGLVHPEMGHLFIPRREGDNFSGICPYHENRCLEGLASGPAIEVRWGVRRAEMLPPYHAAWELEAHYLALALGNIILALSPQRIILGGGVMHQSRLFGLIRGRVQDLLNGYVNSEVILSGIESYIVPPGRGDDAGVLGAILLAEDAAQRARVGVTE